MRAFYDWFEKHKVPINISAVLSGVANSALAVFALFYGDEPWKAVLWTLFALVLVVLLLFLLAKLLLWVDTFRRIVFYRNWDAVPDEYKVERTLRFLGDKAASIDIVGRTCFRWLCGDEAAFERNDGSFETGQLNLQAQLRTAVQKGAYVRLVMQNPNIPVPYFSAEENRLLHRHAEAAIASYSTILSQLTPNERQRMSLLLSSDIVENSMARLTRDGLLVRFVLDLSIKFKAPLASGRTMSKPVLIFRSRTSDVEEYEQELDFMIRTAIYKEAFDKRKSDGLSKVQTKVLDHPYSSGLRNDQSNSLLHFAARSFLARSDLRNVRNTPPLCVHMLITNDCSTHCAMCDHWRMHDPKREMSIEEIYHVLDSIRQVGTESLVISGGEPLAHKEIFNILQYGAQKGLRMGLLSNGVVKRKEENEDEERVALDSDQARIVAQTCSWVQLSIDSFRKDTYALIRGFDCLALVLESLTNLHNAGLQDIEVCYTIQQHNFEEVSSLSEDANAAIPGRIPVRLKFAHGPSYGRRFLCSEEQIQHVLDNLPVDARFNREYLTEMVGKDYFRPSGISDGAPLADMIMEFKGRNYRCQILGLTCVVDAFGDVYPCCFLFDDNSSRSQRRPGFRVGSLRVPRRVPAPDGSRNSFADVWYRSDSFEQLRQQLLPIDREACGCCTRYFYQNEFLNEVCHIFESYGDYGIAERLADGEPLSPIWL